MSDLYGMEGAVVDGGVGYTDFPMRMPGGFENALRYEQYGVPANVSCANPSGYIADHDTRRYHAPLRIGSVETRAAEMAAASCSPRIPMTFPVENADKVAMGKMDAKCLHKTSEKIRPSKETKTMFELLVFMLVIYIGLKLCRVLDDARVWMSRSNPTRVNSPVSDGQL